MIFKKRIWKLHNAVENPTSEITGKISKLFCAVLYMTYTFVYVLYSMLKFVKNLLQQFPSINIKVFELFYALLYMISGIYTY